MILTPLFLRPGTFITRHLANNDRSFTISSHTSFVILSFDATGHADDVEDGALWVQAGFLEGESLATARHSGNNLILLENIYAGAELVFKCAVEDPQAQFYVQWGGQLISIRYCY